MANANHKSRPVVTERLLFKSQRAIIPCLGFSVPSERTGN